AERPQEADRDRLYALAEQLADRGLGFLLVELDHDFAEAVDALGDAADQALRHDRRGLGGLRKMHHLADVAPAVAARAAHDVDRVLVAARGDEADPGAALLDDGVGAHGRAVRQEGDIAAELAELEAERLGARAERVHHAAREVRRRRGHLGGEELAGAVHDRAVGERAADVDADQVAHFAILAAMRALIAVLLLAISNAVPAQADFPSRPLR